MYLVRYLIHIPFTTNECFCRKEKNKHVLFFRMLDEISSRCFSLRRSETAVRNFHAIRIIL